LRKWAASQQKASFQHSICTIFATIFKVANPNAGMAQKAPLSIVVCGDRHSNQVLGIFPTQL